MGANNFVAGMKLLCVHFTRLFLCPPELFFSSLNLESPFVDNNGNEIFLIMMTIILSLCNPSEGSKYLKKFWKLFNTDCISRKMTQVGTAK